MYARIFAVLAGFDPAALVRGSWLSVTGSPERTPEPKTRRGQRTGMVNACLLQPFDIKTARSPNQARTTSLIFLPVTPACLGESQSDGMGATER